MITALPPPPLSGQGNVSASNLVLSLSLAQDASTATITPSGGGAAVTILAATDTVAGMLDAARATKIDNLSSVGSSGKYSDLIGLPSLAWEPNFIIDGGGSVITTGQKGFIQIGIPLVLTNWTLMADQSGSIAIDIWKVPSASFPPTVANSITAGAPPSLVSQQYNSGSVIVAGQTGGTVWTTTTLNVGDILAFNVNSVATVQRVTLALLGTHS